MLVDPLLRRFVVMSGGHWTLPTGSPAIRLKNKKKTSEYRDDLLEGSSFLFGDVPIPVTAADQSIRTVYVRYLPFEVTDCVVKSAFESFGVVHSVHPCFFRDFPSVVNGTRRLVMSSVALFHRLCPWLSFLCVCSMPASLLPVPFVMNPVICLGSVLFRVCACVASSKVTWPETVRRPGAPPVPIHLFLCLFRLLLVLLSPCPLTLNFVPLCLFHPLPLTRLPFHRLCLPSPLQFCLFLPLSFLFQFLLLLLCLHLFHPCCLFQSLCLHPRNPLLFRFLCLFVPLLLWIKMFPCP